MTMVRKLCTACGKTCWHNPLKDGGLRCTYCGTPPGTGPKRERNETIINRQIAKARLNG